MVKYINLLMFYEIMKKIPLFILQLFWRYRFSKWIYRIEHLETLVKVLQCISPKLGVNAQTKIQEFCREARIVIEAGGHTSRQILDELETLLQEISNDSKLRRFLGRHEPTIGEAWSSAKMHAFLHAIVMWQNENSCHYRFVFNMEYALSDLNANDFQVHGPTAGPLFRSKIHLIWIANGQISTSFDSVNSARIIASTPRSTNPLNSTMSTPVSSPRKPELTRAPEPEPIHSERTERISDRTWSSQVILQIPCFLQSLLLSKAFLQFLKDAHDLTRLEREGNIWFLYDRLAFFQRVYGVSIFYNPNLNCSFLDAFKYSKLVEDALRICLNGEPEDDSLHNLAIGSNDNQTMFLDTLKMVVMHELWLIQNEGKAVSPFVYKAPQGVWKQDPVTFEFSLFPVSLGQIIEAA
jgi:hypothetical protein